MSDSPSTTSSSGSASTTTKTAAKKPDDQPAGDLAAETQDMNTERERAQIKANQERYEARVGGATSAELNEEAREERADALNEATKQKKGGQVTEDDEV